MIRTKKILRVLVVDDSDLKQKIVIKILTELFKNHDYYLLKLEVASDGQEGFELYKQALSSDSGFGLVIIDFNMPKMNGYECSQAIRDIKINGFLNQPVIFGYSDSFPDQAVQSGVLNEIFPHNIRASMLRAALKEHLSIELPIVPTPATSPRSSFDLKVTSESTEVNDDKAQKQVKTELPNPFK